MYGKTKWTTRFKLKMKRDQTKYFKIIEIEYIEFLPQINL